MSENLQDISTFSRAFSPVLRFEDSQGHPLANGTLCTYVSGTYTPCATLKGFDGVFNSPQIKLNSNGECDVILDSKCNYRFELKDAFGRKLWTRDNVMSNKVGVLPDHIMDAIDVSGDTLSVEYNSQEHKYIIKISDSFVETIGKSFNDVYDQIDKEIGSLDEKIDGDRSDLINMIGKIVFSAYYKYGGTSTFKDIEDALSSGADIVNLHTIIDKSVFILELKRSVFDSEGNRIIAFEFSGINIGKVYTYTVFKDDHWEIDERSIPSEIKISEREYDDLEDKGLIDQTKRYIVLED